MIRLIDLVRYVFVITLILVIYELLKRLYYEFRYYLLSLKGYNVVELVTEPVEMLREEEGFNYVVEFDRISLGYNVIAGVPSYYKEDVNGEVVIVSAEEFYDYMGFIEREK